MAVFAAAGSEGLVSRGYIMADGKIVALDTPANLKAKYNAANIEEVFLKIARN